MYTIDKFIPKKTNRRIYYTRENGSDSIMAYSILTYDRTARSFDDSLETRQLRSAITSSPENYLLSMSPPTSTSLELFQNKHPQVTNNIQITEIIEGTLIHLFYDYRLSQWEIATKNAIGGNYHLFNRKNKTPLETDHPKIRDMFFDCLRLPRGSTAIPDVLSKKHSYCFVMRHPNNPIVMNIQTPELFLVAVYDIYPNRAVIVPQTVFQTWTCFKDMPIIRFPILFDTVKSLSWNDYKSMAIENRLPGINFLDLESGDRCKIENPIYENQRRVSHTNANDMLYQYLCLRRINQVTLFLKHFPENKDLFRGFYEDYKAFIENVHEKYISKYIHKNRESNNAIINYINKQLHSYYLENGRKTPITKHVIFDFCEREFTPDELLYFMNENARQYFHSSFS
jgi:hypothetical protein